MEKAKLQESTSKLNSELENLSNKLKDKEHEIDTDRLKVENQINDVCSERDMAVKESKVLKDKLNNFIQQKQEYETHNLVQIQS